MEMHDMKGRGKVNKESNEQAKKQFEEMDERMSKFDIEVNKCDPMNIYTQKC